VYIMTNATIEEYEDESGVSVFARNSGWGMESHEKCDLNIRKEKEKKHKDFHFPLFCQALRHC
jgi:hypothetical protein